MTNQLIIHWLFIDVSWCHRLIITPGPYWEVGKAFLLRMMTLLHSYLLESSLATNTFLFYNCLLPPQKTHAFLCRQNYYFVPWKQSSIFGTFFSSVDIPNRPILVRFGDTPGAFGRAMVHILVHIMVHIYFFHCKV